MISFKRRETGLTHKVISAFVAFSFIFTSVFPPQVAAQSLPTILNLPAPGMMVTPTIGYTPAIIRGITINPENPLNFTFYVSKGDTKINEAQLQEESNKLIKYFLATLTTPSQDLWVNLSPYEKDQMVTPEFGVTEMGRDLLAQDYVLKQLTASLMYPENELGQKFWKRVHQKAFDRFGTTEIPVETFNKIWIVPERAAVYEHNGSAFVVNSHLKVMLAQDYLALQESIGRKDHGLNQVGKQDANAKSELVSDLIQEILIPEIEKEVNEGETFANLRQVFNSMILATWFKNNLKETLLGQVYVNQKKVAGVDVDDPEVKEKIYQQYLKAFNLGVYNYIKEEYDPSAQKIVPRQYFSGGAGFQAIDSAVLAETYNDRSLRFASPEVIGGAKSIAEDAAMVALDVDLYEADPLGKNAAVIAAAVEQQSDQAMSAKAPTRVQQKIAQIAHKANGQAVADFVERFAAIYNAAELEIIGLDDEDRLIQEAIAAGELYDMSHGPYGKGTYVGASHPSDVQRVVARTFVATNNSNDKGKFNNWVKADDIKAKVMPYFRNSLGGTKKLYLIPFVMQQEGADYGVPSFQLTDSRYVALQSLTMAGVGEEAWRTLAKTGKFNRGIHLTGDLDKLTEEREQSGVDNRYFISLPEEGLTISYGSNYGGNVLFGKKFEGLRLASWQAAKAWDQGEFKLAEHMALIQVKNLKTGVVRNIAFAAPSNSGKTNFAMMKVPDIYKDKYEIKPISDDLSHMRIIDGKLMAFNPERGVFGVVTDTDPEKNPKFWDAITTPGKKVIFTNMAYNLETGEIAWKGNDTFPGNITNWRDWQGNLISSRQITQTDLDNTKVAELKGKKLADLTAHQRDLLKWTKATLEHPNGRATIPVANISSLSPDYYNPQGVEVHAIFHGGRVGTKGFEPLVRRLRTPQEGIYSLMTMLVESTAAEVGKVGEKLRDPAAMRPFFSLHEIEYFEHWERMMEKLGDNAPAFFHVNWFAKDDQGRIMWPGYSENLRVIDWALRMLDGEADFESTPIGDVPTIGENGLDIRGLKISDETMNDVLSVNPEIWKEEAQDALSFLQSLASEKRPLPAMFRTINQQILQGFQDAAMLGEVDMSKFQVTPKWGPELAEYTGEGKVINPETNKLKAQLTQKWAGTIAALLRKRGQKQEAVDAGKAKHGFMAADQVVEDAYGEQKTAQEIREGDWVVDTVPEPLTRPGAILTGPWGDAKWAINSLSSGAVRIFNDYEDAGWDKGIAGIKAQQTQMDILNGKITSYQGPKREYAVPDRTKWPVLTTRVRGLHFNSKFFSYAGVKTPAIVEDLVSLIVNNRQQLIEQGSGINVVVPKLQSAEELKTVAQIISDIEQAVGLKRGTVKIILMNERIELSLELEEALWAARHHVAVTNVGRWDKLASDIMARRNKSDEIEPNPTAVGVDSPHMEAYINRNVAISLKRGAEPEGGMVVQMMSRGASHPETDAWVVQKIKSDKITERNQGMKFAWVATPQVVGAVNEIFQAGDYSNRAAAPYGYTSEEEAKLLQLPKGPRTKEGVRKAVYDALAYAIGFRTAGGAVAIVDESRPGLRLMQDLAVLKINYYWLWKLVKHQASLDDSEQKVTKQYIEQVIDEQVAYIKSMAEPGDGRADRFEDKDWEAVGQTLKQLVTAPQMVTWESVVMNTLIDEQDADVLAARLKGVFSSRQELVTELNRLRKQKQNLRLAKIALAAHDEVFYNPNIVNLTDTEKTNLRVNASRMVPRNGGILAADESTGSAQKRLDMVHLENTYENRQEMRRLMLTAAGLAGSGINSVILYKETFDNVDLEGRNIIREHLLANGILPGIKTDGGLKDDPASPGEQIPDPAGLINLPSMLAIYKAKGAVFTKWRTVQHINPATGLPTDRNIRLNAVVQAQQAKITQEAGLVPIIEPEVMFEKATHDLAASYAATTRTLAITFEELIKAGVYLEGMVLKTSMILAGQKAAEQTDSKVVGFETLKGLLKTVPAKVPAIVFLSGGQDDNQVVENLNEVILASQRRFIEARDAAVAELETEGNTQRADEVRQLKEAPWEISYSFGRGLQRPALLAWNGTTAGFEAGQQTMVATAQQVQKARLGQLHADDQAMFADGDEYTTDLAGQLHQIDQRLAFLRKEGVEFHPEVGSAASLRENRKHVKTLFGIYTGAVTDEVVEQMLKNIYANEGFQDEAMTAEENGTSEHDQGILREVPLTNVAQRETEVMQQWGFQRNDQGRWIKRRHSIHQVAAYQYSRNGRNWVTTNAVQNNFNAKLRRHFRRGTGMGTYGSSNNVQAEAMVRSKIKVNAPVYEVDLIDVTDDTAGLRNDLIVHGYLDANGRISQKLFDLKKKADFQLSEQYKNVQEAALGVLLYLAYKKIEGDYKGGWDAIMQEGSTDQARSYRGPMYLGELSAKIARLFKRHDSSQNVKMDKMTPEAREAFELHNRVDFDWPLFVDADEGHLKIRELVQAVMTMGPEDSLIAALHIEDQAHGCKKCGHMSGKVLSGTEQWLRVLNNARFQFDAMGLNTMIVARTDGEAAEWITTTLDGRDQRFLFGATDFNTAFEAHKAKVLADARTKNKTEPEITEIVSNLEKSRALLKDSSGLIRPYHEVIEEARAKGIDGAKIQTLHSTWKSIAGLMTIQKAVEVALKKADDAGQSLSITRADWETYKSAYLLNAQNAPKGRKAAQFINRVESSIDASDRIQMTVQVWQDFIDNIPAEKNIKFFTAVKSLALNMGLEVVNTQEWRTLQRTAPEKLNDINLIFWDFELTKTEENDRQLWMINSGIEMASARSVAAMPQADISWMEQHHPHVGEVKHWAEAIDTAAVNLVVDEFLYEIMGNEKIESLKEPVAVILEKYLHERPDNPQSFIVARQELLGLGLSKKQTFDTLNAATRLKANNTSPSFFWPEAKNEEGTALMTDEEKRQFLVEQGKYSQFNFATYFGSVLLHVQNQLFNSGFPGDLPEKQRAEAETTWNALKASLDRGGYLADGMLTVSLTQKLGRLISNEFVANPQIFSGTDSNAWADAAGNGMATVLAALGGQGDTMSLSKATRADQAMQAQRPNVKGGIDLNPDLLDLQIKRDGNGIPLPMLQQPVDVFKNIEGFIPVIINLTPVTNMPLILGFAGQKGDPTEYSYDEHQYQSDEPKAKLDDDQFDKISFLK